MIRGARFLEADRREIALRRSRHNQLGFAYPVAFVRPPPGLLHEFFYYLSYFLYVLPVYA